MREYTKYHRLNTQDAEAGMKLGMNYPRAWSSDDKMNMVELTSQGSVSSTISSLSENSEASTTSGSDEEFSDARSICSTDSYYISTTGRRDDVIGNYSEFSTQDEMTRVEGVEESTRILAALQLQMEEEKQTLGLVESKRRRELNFLHDVEALSVEELMRLKERLEDHIVNVNMELVDELKVRDSLYSEHQALLTEAEDASNIDVRCNNDVERSGPEECRMTEKEKKKRWSLWW